MDKLLLKSEKYATSQQDYSIIFNYIKSPLTLKEIENLEKAFIDLVSDSYQAGANMVKNDLFALREYIKCEITDVIDKQEQEQNEIFNNGREIAFKHILEMLPKFFEYMIF